MGTFMNGIAIRGEHLFQICEPDEAEKKAAIISAEKNCSVISAYIYDGDFWGYTLYINGEKRDEFSTMPEYFKEDKNVIRKQTADLPLLSRAFAVAPERVEKYLYNWTNDLLDVESTAYEDDKFSYGDAWQVVDFLGALGFLYPEQQMYSDIEDKIPTLLEIIEHKILPFSEGRGMEEYPLIDKLPSAFSNEYIRHLLKEEGINAFELGNKTPQNVIKVVTEYCLSVKMPEQDILCQRLNVLAAYCSFWMSPGSGWYYLDCATYEPVCINYEKPTDIYVLRARAAITDFSKRHRAIRDLKRLIELDYSNIELYQTEIRKWEEREKDWMRGLNKH
ncbi:MAG: hypothetical protein IKL22_12280 [Lachnospiraceae bacterium]|nr:hypothetical protein [Lachnospiraceae bacterium]